jgi:hydrogenase maturation protein HypF
MEFKKINLPFKIKRPVLALGSQTKNSVCFAQGNFAYLSQIHSDLNSLKDFAEFEKTVKYFLNKNPKIIAYDLHPEYQSTKYAQQLSAIGYQLSAVQHHHSHIASCMVENGLKNQKLIGVVFDGTGLSNDNTLWGAEFFLCNYRDFKRIAHLKEIPLLGGERAILEPWRLAAIWLYRLYRDNFLKLDIEFMKKIDKKKWRVLKNMYLSGFNSPLASSMGRFFDAAASLILAKCKVNFEAELAMELEETAKRYRLKAASYDFSIIQKDKECILDPTPVFKEIVKDLKARQDRKKIAYRFHLTVAWMIKRACLILRKESSINKVVLSGGVFQNKILLSLSLDLLSKEGFKVFWQQELPCSDAGIALGQIAIANFRYH